MVAQKGLIMKKSESKDGVPSKKQQLKWKTCDLCNNIMYDDEKTLDRHCNSRGHTRFLACVIDTPLPVCGWKCPLCNALCVFLPRLQCCVLTGIIACGLIAGATIPANAPRAPSRLTGHAMSALNSTPFICGPWCGELTLSTVYRVERRRNTEGRASLHPPGNLSHLAKPGVQAEASRRTLGRPPRRTSRDPRTMST